MSVPREAHWEKVYDEKSSDGVSWYAPRLETSLELLKDCGLTPSSPVLDVGGGASTLVDDLLSSGYREVSVLDISARALEVSRKRMGPLAMRVNWIVGDITTIALPENAYDFWHDRAVFHFLTAPEDRARYRAVMASSLRRGARAVIATFALKGPDRCSGLEVCRYSPSSLACELGGDFRLDRSCAHRHVTPFGTTQEFQYSVFEKVSGSSSPGFFPRVGSRREGLP